MFCSGVSISVLLCKDLVLLMVEMVMLMCWLGFEKVGRLVVMIIVVVFFRLGEMLGGNCRLSWFEVLCIVCVVYLRLLLFVFVRLMMML